MLEVNDSWDPFDALALIGDIFSEDYSFAGTLDSNEPYVLEGGPASFDTMEMVLSDSAVDFKESEVWVGDLVALYESGSSTPAYGRVTQVDQHTLVVDVPLSVPVAGYGDGYYGQWVYGGKSPEVTIDSYKIWVRRTSRIDYYNRLDEASHDVVSYLASLLHSIYSNFVFLVKINWPAVRDDGALRDVITFMNTMKPADTGFIPMTRPYETGLSDTINSSIDDEEPSRSVVPNFLFVSYDVGGYVGVNGQYDPNVGSFIG